MVTDIRGLPRAKQFGSPPLCKKRLKIEGCSKVMGSNQKAFEEFRRKNQNVFHCKTNQWTKKKEKETVLRISCKNHKTIGGVFATLKLASEFLHYQFSCSVSLSLKYH